MGRANFSRCELTEIKALLREIRRADRSRQKSLRGRLCRQYDFYISDFASDQAGFTPSDVDALVQRGVITVNDQFSSSTPEPTATSSEEADPQAGAGSTGSQVPALPQSFERTDLEALGFAGWRTWEQLRASELADVPSAPGAYLVFRDALTEPIFLDASPAGHFKGRDPTVSLATLADKWVQGARVVYIGKANVLRRRLRQYARFGANDPVGHWGGRFIWQLADSDELLVAWHAISWDEVARGYERRLVRRFAELHDGRRPFANLAS